MNTYPSATAEFMPLDVKVGDVPATAYEVAVVPWDVPSTAVTSWANRTEQGGLLGVIISGLAAGYYRVWARVNGAVVDCGFVCVVP